MRQPCFHLASSAVQTDFRRGPNVWRAFCASLLALSLLTMHPPARLFAQDNVSLELGKPLSREISGGETHAYQIELAAGQFMRAVVEQQGVNLLVTLYSPNGQKLADLDSPVGAEGPEPVSLVAETSGAYRLQVRPMQQHAPQGRYEVRLEEVRAATPQDKARIIAERAFAEATITYQGSADSVRQGIEKYEKVIPLWQALGDRGQEAVTLSTIGHLYKLLGESRQALAYQQRALPLHQAAGNRSGAAQTLYNMGAVYGELGDPQKALTPYQQALDIYQALGDRSMEAAVFGNMGVIYSGLGEQQQALELFNRALVLKRAMRDPYGEATLLNNIGLVQNYLGESQQALDSYQRALPLYRALNHRAGESTALNNIATLYDDLGDPLKALEFLEQVLELKRATGNRVEEATALNNIAVAYGKLKEHQKALEYYQRALPLSRGARSMEATTLGNLGKTYGDLGDQRKALQFYEQALQLRREIGDRRGEAITLTNQGRAYRGLGEFPKALECFKQALSLRQIISDRSGEAITRYNLAVAQRDLNQLTDAQAQSAAALALVEALRTKVASQGLRTSYLASVQQYYELDIDLLMRLHEQQPAAGYAAVALQTCERAHARSLLELLTEARADLRQGVSSDLLAREHTLQQALDTKAAAQMRLLNGKHTTEQAATAAKEISALTTDYEQVQTEIRRASPRYAALTQPAPLNLNEIQTTVLDADTLLLEYALGEERSWLWAVTPTSIKSFALPKRADIEVAARRVYDSLTARNQAPANETPEQRRRRLEQAAAAYSPAAAALSQVLLSPVAAELGAKRLLIVADSVLQYVPFAALPELGARDWGLGAKQKQLPAAAASDGRLGAKQKQPPAPSPQPLIAAHEIVSLPSASVLAVLRQENASRKSAGKALAVLADPVFQGNDPRLATANATRTGEAEFVRLRFSRAEAEEIASLAPAAQTLKALDFAANRETATSAELGDYRIVHFATHALINQQHPELSGIVLSQVDERGQPRNGFLRLHEIYNLRLSAELVVLSACETALGKEVKGEGMIGLTRGFMYAGAPRVAASLWRTDDRAAAELMKRFYQRMLGEKMTAAAALRAAQVSLWQDKRWETPYYWAVFTLQGEWK
ncbi:MAG: CHAT domain-containing protein [Acidobacteria bacterium]|nr:CHAT domain-containing protein [Acidobacteriota bacterium]MBI3421931.1 CHAT domain-containing protein [Acidobacteriota bacterium]